MPATTSCPVSEVDRALSSYINSKQETLRIRRALAKYLAANVKRNNSRTYLHLDHECPTDDVKVNTAPTGVKQTRAAYLHALQAKLQAQLRRQRLQASLDELQNGHNLETTLLSESTYDEEASRDYISLLRQRRRLSELQVIQESLEKLLNANSTETHKDPKLLVKEAVGDQPDLPAERLDRVTEPQENDLAIFKLKKEVLEAKAGMDRVNAAKTEAQDVDPRDFDLKQQVYALECARDEIVAWVEEELGKLSEDSELLEDASPVKRWPQDNGNIEVASSAEHIRGTYQQYTASRLSLIEAHQSVQQHAFRTDSKNCSETNAQASQDPSVPATAVKTVAAILPHISSIAQITKNERFLLQQTVYLQSQVTAADEETTEALSRLGDESHLLPSGNQGPVAWATAASEAGKSTQAFVDTQLQESYHQINSVNTIVDLCSLQSKVLAST